MSIQAASLSLPAVCTVLVVLLLTKTSAPLLSGLLFAVALVVSGVFDDPFFVPCMSPTGGVWMV